MIHSLHVIYRHVASTETARRKSTAISSYLSFILGLVAYHWSSCEGVSVGSVFFTI